MDFFPVRLRAAAIVPRWSIVWTMRQDYLSSHTFFVAFYTRQLCTLLNWDLPATGHAVEYALIHDLDELITGDIVGTVKNEIIDPQKANRFISIKMQEQLLTVTEINANHHASLIGTQVRQVVKVADQLDALFYALTEAALGNKIIGARVNSCIDRLRRAWSVLIPDADRAEDLWDLHIEPAIEAHRDPRNYDIALAPKP